MRLETAEQIVDKFEKAVIEAQHKLANAANKAYVTRLRNELIKMLHDNVGS